MAKVRNKNFLTEEEKDLFDGLTADEIAEFNQDLDEKDEDLLPAGLRGEDQTTKDPTGPFDREKLMTYLKDEAVSQPDLQDPHYVPFEKKTRGRVFKKKEKSKTTTPLLPDDLSDVLDAASEDDLLELAAVLGIHGMLTQKQSETADEDKTWDSLKGSGLRKYKGGITKATKVKEYTDNEAVNELDMEEALAKLKAGDETLEELNLNNHQEVTEDILMDIVEHLKNNTSLKKLHLANTQMKDHIGEELAEALKSNTTLEILNLESNFLKAESVMALLKVIEVNESLKELKLANQYNKIGHKAEQAMAKSLAKNTTILRFGYNFDSRGPRHTCNKYVMRNNDIDRQKRQEAKRQNGN
ncbi:tropomodulin-2-like [Clytia hemisphaerica]|uniref:Tropomodulin n=1 Tax=Clytia hemisphaerica TaxID=252671 RepID=A0A7M5UZW4_9CNID|eukprot:TCONS_00047330-protein